ncbi:MAG: hypothetical protein RO009_21815 [Pseudorhodoplanes sp.]|nr:hypothetical protein [Pseudorhodoplanes sp.]
MTTAQAPVPDAGKLIMHLTGVMADIITIVEHETELVRAGKLTEAAKLEPAKTALAQQYMATANILQGQKPLLAKAAPDQLDALRRRHDEFHALLQINLTVLATAHAVSEGIMRGVSAELARKSAPQTYGASGQHSAPSPSAAQPLAVSRVL